MGSYLARKIINLLGAFFITVTLTFFLMKAVPGSPFTSPRGVPQEIIASMEEHYGLNAPMLEQYTRYIQSILKGDLGPSFKYKDRRVSEILFSHFPVSMRLGLQALALSLILGLSFGTIAAYHHRGWLDQTILVLVTLFISVPSFLLGTFLQYFFAIKLAWLPIAQWGSFAQSVLPTLALSALPTAFITRLIRSSLIETLSCDFVKTATVKGLTRRRIFLVHVLPNAILPTLSFLGFYVGLILTGSFVVEKIFGIPGLGQVLVHAVNNRDYGVIMGMTIFGSSVFLITVFISELISLAFDPRNKTQELGGAYVK